MLAKPYTLAALPHDLTGSSGRIVVGDVHAIAGPKKRKRSEIAVAIDHQGINIYDVQSSKLVTSYAVSPQAVFTCPPCSIRYRKEGSQASRRYTYCSLNSPKPQLLCFSETSPTKSDPAGNILIHSIKPTRGSQVTTLDTINAPGGEDHGTPKSKLVAVHGDGTVTCYTHNLGSEEWSTQDSPSPQSAPITRVEHAVVVGLEQARRTILKNREDILASLNPGGEEADSSLLLLTTRSAPGEGHGGHATLTLQILYIESQSLGARNLFTGTAAKVKELLSLLIPEPRDFSSRSPRFSFHTATGTMYHSAGGKLAVYDFARLIPRLAHHLDLGQDTRTSYLRLSTNLIACSSTDHLSVVDLPYCSLQAQIKLEGLRELKNSGDEKTSKADFELVSFHAPLDLAIALHGRKLHAIQLATKTSSPGGVWKNRKRDGLLINAIGRGSSLKTNPHSGPTVSGPNIKSLGTYLPQPSVHNSWSNQIADLDRVLSQNDAEGFEKTAASILGMEINDAGKRKRNSTHHSHFDQRNVYCVLSRVFCVKEPEHEAGSEASGAPNGLKIRLLPRKIYEALVENGVFQASHIESSLKSTGALSNNSKLAPGALIQALAEWDTSLELVSSFLTSSIPLSSAELVHVLAIVTRDSDAAYFTENPKLLMNGGGEDEYDDVQMLVTNRQSTQNSSSPPPVFAGSDHSHHLLTLTMKKLYIIPSASVVRALRSGLSTAQLRILVDALRMEIARSGWLSPYEDSQGAIDPKHQDNNQICYVAQLLNCAIDSIGIGGWILGSSITDELAETSDTIAYMKAEISAALEGIEEATYLKGMLGEILLCGKYTFRSRVKIFNFDESHLMALPTKPLSIPLEEASNVLPLGLKPAHAISFGKVGAGGELMKRTARDIGRQKSKMVGKYSFERIAI